MPYIKQDARNKFEIYPLTEAIKNTGELNYVITQIVQNYYYNKGMNYKAINDVLGALEGAKLEFYRRIAVPYEDKKIVLNGDL